MKHLYIPNTLPSLKMLNHLYGGILPSLTELDALHEAYKKAKSERTGGKYNECPGEAKSQELFFERERAYEVAVIRLRRTAKDLYPLLQPLYDEATAVRRRVDNRGSLTADETHVTEAANVAAAEDAYNRGCAIYFESKLMVIGEYAGIKNAYLGVREEPREYLVITSTNGSAFRFNVGDLKNPPLPPYMTLKEARTAADSAVGCIAAIYHVPTGRMRATADGPWVQVGEGTGTPESR